MKFLFTQILNMIFDGSAKVLTDISALSLDIFSQAVVTSLLNFFQLLGWIILAVGILFGIANFCIEHIEGNDIPLEDLFMGIFKGIIAVSFIKDGAIFIFTLADTITSTISGIAPIKGKDIDGIIKSLISGLAQYTVLWEILLVFIVLGLWFIILIQSLKRSGMYMMQIMVGYLYIFGLPSGNTEGILDWSRQTIALAVTNVLQISTLIVALNLMITAKIMPAMVLLFAATSAEKIAGRFGMSAGGKQTIGSIGRGITSAAQVVNSFR